jgi:hypothetical protein
MLRLGATSSVFSNEFVFSLVLPFSKSRSRSGANRFFVVGWLGG